MLKIYKNGEEFLLDNQEILDNNLVETAFFRLNGKFIKTFERYNYCFKLYDENSFLLVLKMEPYNLLLYGDEKFLEEASNVICDYNLHFTGVLASLNLVEGFYSHYKDRRQGKTFVRHKMDIMEMDIRQTVGNRYFKMDGCVYQLAAEVNVTSDYGYGFSIERDYSYE